MERVEHKSSRLLSLTILLLALGVVSEPLYGRKTNQSLYEDAFDIAGGGASLTRASRDGRIYANPALLPYGGKLHRWAGSTTSVMAGGSALDQLQGKSSDSESEGDESAPLPSAPTTTAHLTIAESVSYITAYGGASLVAKAAIDGKTRKIGDNGTPEARLLVDIYNALSLAAAVPSGMRWLSLGATCRYVRAIEGDLAIGLDDFDQISDENGNIDNAKAGSYLQQKVGASLQEKQGIGFDLGALFFLQGRRTDYSLALKIDDVGNTKLSDAPSILPFEKSQDEGIASISPPLNAFKQVVSIGSAITFHNKSDAIHLAIDYRDLFNAYDEPLFKKIYTGMKITLRQHLGIGLGLYHGAPSLGAELDLVILRITLAKYTKELSSRPGGDPRQLYVAALSIGF